MSWRERHLAKVRRLEEAAAEVVLGELDKVMDQAAAVFAATTAAADDDPAADAGSLDDLSSMGASWAASVDGTILPWFGEVYENGADAAVEQIAETTGADIPPAPPDMMNESAARHLAKARPRFTDLGDEAWTRARAQMVEGMAAGDDVGAMRRRIRSVTDLSRAQADQLARTETIAAANAGSTARVRLMPEDVRPGFKQWMATEDARTRPTHAAADEQVVALNDRFQVGVASLDYPGDYAGPPEEVINCRCTCLYLETPEPLRVMGRQQGGIVDLTEVPPASAAPGGVALLERPVVAHQAGKHNQKTHGRGGGGSGGDGPDGDGPGGGGGGEFAPAEFETASGGFSVKAAKEYQAKEMGALNSDLSPQQRRVIQDYAGDNTFSHYAINAHLRGIPGRGGRPVPKSSVDRKIANMDAAFEHQSARLPTDLRVHRGMTGPFAARLVQAHRNGQLRTSAGGARMRDRGFVSTSMDRRQANVFSREGNRGERVNIEYRLRAGQRGIAPSQTGSLGARHANELEVILPRGQTYEVLEASMGSNGVLNVAVEVV